MNQFERLVHDVDAAALHATGIDLLQLNVGLRCNEACSHCHHSSSPTRTEQMSDDVFAAALALARRLGSVLVDVTGGAPELHPRIRHFVEALRGAGLAVQVRTNLSALLEPDARDLPELFARLGVRLLASLPCWEPGAGPRHRPVAIATAIAAMRRLNALGYGAGHGLVLDLAYNPEGTSLPEPQEALAARLREGLRQRFDLRFDDLRALTNMPIGRFGASLSTNGGRHAYVAALAAAFNPATVAKLACRRSLVVAWDGTLWDCDFNLGAGLRLTREPRTVESFDEDVVTRRIAFGPHCFACTAQAGSS
jgi:radical SAM/Cys-rich protein